MSEQRWIIVRNWRKFQHYGKRTPPWIKLYTELLDDPNYGALSHAQRSTLCGLWLMYARSRCQIPDSTAWITRQLGVRVTRATLVSLNHAGFIHFSASKPLAPRARSRRDREENVKEKNYVRKTSSYEAELSTGTDGEEPFDYEQIKYAPREVSP